MTARPWTAVHGLAGDWGGKTVDCRGGKAVDWSKGGGRGRSFVRRIFPRPGASPDSSCFFR